jgi:FkbM family methyltransferase
MQRRQLVAKVPVAFEFPDTMLTAIQEVLAGEYEPGYFGGGLTILDLGANVGAFTLWANMRWPGSTIHAYEPQPETYRMLARNVDGLVNVHAVEAAIYPSEQSHQLLWSRHAGDVEAGLVESVSNIFNELAPEQLREVRIVHPMALPKADIVKLDVEGAEASILGAMDLSGVSLVLLEYHNDEGRTFIKQLLGRDFEVVKEEAFGWDRSLLDPAYKQNLAGNHFGHLFLVRRGIRKLRPEVAVVRTARDRARKYQQRLLRAVRALRRALAR